MGRWPRTLRASSQAQSAASEGGEAVERTVDTTETIRSTVTDAAALIKDLGTRSEEIGNIVSVINDIADQTNLLALNAAIEAARAGDAGRGFAVVAEEVRKLAERTTQATGEIVALVRSVQDGTAEAIAGVEKGSEQVDAGSKVVSEAGIAIRSNREAVELTGDQIKQIAQGAQDLSNASSEVEQGMSTVMEVVERNSSAAEEMASQAGELAGSIGEIASVSEENSASAEEVSASVEELSAQVEEMAAAARELDSESGRLGEAAGQFELVDAAKAAKRIESDVAEPVAVAATNGASDSAGIPVGAGPEV